MKNFPRTTIKFELELELSNPVSKYKAIQSNVLQALHYHATTGGFVSEHENSYTKAISIRCKSSKLKAEKKRIYADSLSQ